MSLMDDNDAKACAELFRRFVDQIEDGKPYDHVMAVTARLYARTAQLSMRLTRRMQALAYLAHVIDDTYGGRQ
jgi:hypothetical protein